ncbi:MAG TPA: GGDEF domain-containing protein [Thermoanaerobaculia bacterium]|nr:GGDEF domain-containing protein [Thermoanaerobaculia bacterium]
MTALGLVLVGLVGTMDHVTGYELSFSIFYLLPIALVSWYSHRGIGLLLSGVCALVWLLADYTAGRSYSHWLLPFWNATVRLGFFTLTTHLLSELKKHLRYEETLARTDQLTLMLNGRAFRTDSSRLLRLAARHRHPVTLGYIDLDHFKAVNDERGHSEGDAVLQSVAATLARCVRDTDVVGRLGGDEFGILMPEIDDAGAQAAFARIHGELSETARDRGWPIGFSIGVAVFPCAPATIDEALRVADSLMYRMKREGKNGVVCEVQGVDAENLRKHWIRDDVEMKA